MYLTGNAAPAQRINPGLGTNVVLLLNIKTEPKCVTKGTPHKRCVLHSVQNYDEEDCLQMKSTLSNGGV